MYAVGIQYLIIYTVLAIDRTDNQLTTDDLGDCVYRRGLRSHDHIIHTALASAWSDNKFTNNAHRGVQKIRVTARNPVTYAPMPSVLFLEARGRAAQLTQGATGKYENRRAPGRAEGRGDGRTPRRA